MGFRIRGKLHTKNDAVQVSEKFRKRGFVLKLDADSQYPQTVEFELTGDRCDSLDKFDLGQEVSVEFELRGREWTNAEGVVRVFNSLHVWGLRDEGGGPREEKPADNGGWK